jgi:hypothetical protein
MNRSMLVLHFHAWLKSFAQFLRQFLCDHPSRGNSLILNNPVVASCSTLLGAVWKQRNALLQAKKAGFEATGTIENVQSVFRHRVDR